MSRTAESRSDETPSLSSPSPASGPQAGKQFNLMTVSSIAVMAFMGGAFFGSEFLGRASAPAPAVVGGLPSGHPNVNPNSPVQAPPLTPEQINQAATPKTSGSTSPQDPPASSSPTSGMTQDPSQGYDLDFDDPAVRAKIDTTSDIDTLVAVGNEEFDRKHPKLAIAAYEKALKKKPFNADVQTDLGVMYRAAHRHDDALNAFRKAASLNPKHIQSRYNIGVVLANDEKDYQGALTAWEEYLKIAPPGPQTDEVKQQVENLKKSLAK